MSTTPYSTESNEHFADPDAVIPNMPPPQSQGTSQSSYSGLPPSSSLTSEHIQLSHTGQGSDLAESASKLSIGSQNPNQSYQQYSESSRNISNPYAPQEGVTTTTTTTVTTQPAPEGAQAHPDGFPQNGSAASINTSQYGSGSGTRNVSSAGGYTGDDSVSSVQASRPSVLRRKLTSFVGFSNLPQQWHQKSIRQGFDLNLLVIGESGLGKSTLLNTLFEVPVHDLDAPHSYESSDSKNGGIGISTTKIELNESGVKLRLSVIDTPGYGDHINNLESWKSISDEVDARFDQYLESQESLDTGASSGSIKDPRIHACLFFIDPTGHSMKPLDVVVMKKLASKVNIVPIIAKADTQTEEEMQHFKHMVLADLRSQEIEIFEPPSYDFDDEETVSELHDLKARVPFAVIGSTSLVVNRNGHQVLGREYPWGVVEVMNEDHNDFVKLRSLLIRNHLEDLHDRTDKLYESYRTEKMIKLGVKQDDSVFDQPDPAVRQATERQQHEQRLAKMEAEMRAVFQQKVTEKETKLKSSETELFQKHREIKEQLDRQHQELEARRQQLQMQLDSKARKSIR